MEDLSRSLQTKIKNKDAVISVVGLGYVGLPLIKVLLNSGFKVLGFDVDQKKSGFFK